MVANSPTGNDAAAVWHALKADIEAGTIDLASGKKRNISDIDAFVTELMNKHGEAW